MRQLSRRNPRRRGETRQSIASDAAMLTHDGDQKSIHLTGGRSRSISASSAILLNQRGPAGDPRRSVGVESVSAAGTGNNVGDNGSAPYTPVASGDASAFSYLPGASQKGQGTTSAGIVNLKSTEAADPYYRPPRPRRATLEPSPTARSHGSWVSADWANKRWSQYSPEQGGSPIPLENPASGRVTPCLLTWGETGPSPIRMIRGGPKQITRLVRLIFTMVFVVLPCLASQHAG